MDGSIAQRYKLQERVGKGGMGEVFLAFDERLQRKVAVKILPEATLADPEAKKRLRDEALALSHLNHPNLATVHDYEQQDGLDLLVMEYVPGENLNESIAKGPWPLARFYDAALQLCDGLGAAHGAGVLHRDLKPGNIRVTPEGRVKILDFGLAKMFATGSFMAASEVSTASMTLVGTPAYISPEQLEGAPASPASDQFSLGLVFYEMLAGQHPFGGPTPGATQAHIAHEPPRSLHKVRPEVPPALERVVERMLAKRPEERFPNIAAAAEALKHARQHPSVRLPLPPPRIRRAVMVVAALAGVLLLAAYLRGPAEIYPSPAMTGTVKQLTFSGNAAVPNWSPDGRYIAFRQDGRIMVMPVEGGGTRTIEVPFSATVWGWMPDSKSVLAHGVDPTTRKPGCYAVDIMSGSSRILVEQAVFPAVSPDGRMLAYATVVGDPEIWLLELQTGKSHLLVKPPRPGDAVYKPKWSPDGKRISYMRWSGDSPGHELWLINADGTGNHLVPTAPIWLGGQYSWTPDGKWVVISGELQGVLSIWKISLEGHDHERLTNGANDERHVTLAPDGRGFAYNTNTELSRIGLLDAATGVLETPFDMTARTNAPIFSSGGQTLFFESLVQGRWQLWRASLGERMDLAPLVAIRGASSFDPAPGRDRSVLYIRADVGRVHRFGDIRWSQTLWRSAEDGGRQEQVSDPSEIVSRQAPSGEMNRSLLYTTHEGGGETLRLVREQGQPATLFHDSASEGIQAFDWGRTDREVLMSLVTEGKEGSSSALISLDPDTKKREILIGPEALLKAVPAAKRPGVTYLHTSPDRKRVALLVPQANPRETHLLVFDLAHAKLEELKRFEGREQPNSLAWSPDGKKLVVNLAKASEDIFLWEPSDSRASGHP